MGGCKMRRTGMEDGEINIKALTSWGGAAKTLVEKLLGPFSDPLRAVLMAKAEAAAARTKAKSEIEVKSCTG